MWTRVRPSRTTCVHAALAVAYLFVELGGARATAQEFDVEAVRASKRLEAVRVAEPITVDGVLDERAWQLAEPASDFLQQFPDEFAPATERSEVWLLYDDEMLYVGGMLYDREPERLVIDELTRDYDSFFSDSFMVLVDTFLDQRTGYGFWISAGGARRDVQAFDNRRNDANWDGVWFSDAVVREDGWSFELAIPFKTLRFPDTSAQEWGLNMLRIINRKNEFALWSPVPREFSHYSVSFAGLLTGIDRVARGHDLRVTPFTTARFDNGTAGSPGWGGEGDGGVDVKWGLTSSMLLDASYRTDFSQVEADTQQINLTRFSLFFPEKRQFFLESPARFQVGLADIESRRRYLVPFFSRRIGLSSAGQPISVIGGLRLTGQAGRQGVGLLTMQTDESDDGPGANFTAARLTRQVADTASVGAFYFGRETAGSGDFNRVAGFEARFAPLQALEVEAFAMRSETTGEAGDWAGRTSMRIDTNAHRARLGLVHVGEAFRHDLGFVRRRGAATAFGDYERIFRPADPGALLREQSLGVSFDATSDERYARSLTRVGSATYGISFRDGGSLNVSANSTYERIDEPFSVGSGLRVSPGEYTFETVSFNYRSNPSAGVSGSVGLEAGEYWNGTQRVASGSLRFRLNEHIAASASLARNSIDLPEGSFAASLVGLRVDWSFTPQLFLNTFIQYNGETDAWLSNTRFNLIHRPLSDIYVVWNEARSPRDTRRAVMLKYTHLIAF